MVGVYINATVDRCVFVLKKRRWVAVALVRVRHPGAVGPREEA